MVHVVCMDLAGGLQSVHGGRKSHMGVAEGWQLPKRSNLPLAGRWQGLEEGVCSHLGRWLSRRQGSVAGSGQFGQAAACCYSNRRSLLPAERMEPDMGKGDKFRKQRKEFEWVKRGRNRRSGDQDGNCRRLGGLCGKGGSCPPVFRGCPIKPLPQGRTRVGPGSLSCPEGEGLPGQEGHSNALHRGSGTNTGGLFVSLCGRDLSLGPVLKTLVG